MKVILGSVRFLAVRLGLDVKYSQCNESHNLAATAGGNRLDSLVSR